MCWRFQTGDVCVCVRACNFIRSAERFFIWGPYFMWQVPFACPGDRPHAQRNSRGKWPTVFVRLCTTYACVLARDASSICSRSLLAVTLALVGLNTTSFSFDTFCTLPTFRKLFVSFLKEVGAWSVNRKQ